MNIVVPITGAIASMLLALASRLAAAVAAIATMTASSAVC